MEKSLTLIISLLTVVLHFNGKSRSDEKLYLVMTSYQRW